MNWIFSRLEKLPIIKRIVDEKTQELQRQLDQKDEFIRTWSHDISNPLNGMTGALGFLKNAKEREDLVYVIETLAKGCRILEDMNTNIKEFLNTGKEKVIFEEINVKPFVVDTVKPYILSADGKNITISTIFNIDDEFKIATDRLRLSMIISNLLNNAIKFTPIKRDIIINTFTIRDHLYIEIKDRGVGIPRSKLEDVFAPYVRLNKNKPGLGIGLSICKRNAELLGIEITVDSMEGIGSTFTIILPCTRTP